MHSVEKYWLINQFELDIDVNNIIQQLSKHSIDMQRGYNLIKNKQFMDECGDDFYDIYHAIIWDEIKNNNI